MPYLIKVGLQPDNDTKVTSKGYFISRSKSTVTVKFGNITVSNKRIKKFKWAGPNLPVIKMLDLNDEEAAKRYLNEKLNIRRRHGYHLQSSGVKIYKWEN